VQIVYEDLPNSKRQERVADKFDVLIPWVAQRTEERIAAGEDERSLIAILDLDDITAALATRDEARELEDVSGVIARAIAASADRGWLQCVAIVDERIMSMRLCLTPVSARGDA
jgi:hypothetical protein